MGGPIAASLASEGAHIALAHIDVATLCWVEAGIKQSGLWPFRLISLLWPSLLRGVASVHQKRMTGHERRIVGSEVERGAGHLLWLTDTS